MMGRTARLAKLPASLLVLLMVLLAGCARIPTSGPVGKSSEGSAGNVSAPVFLPAAPQPGALPETIIDYFYRAGSGYEDDYAVARQYLTQASSVSWKPDQRALVYREARVVATDTENVYNYELDVAYTVDADGIATQSPEGTIENIPVTLTQVDGEWRISDLPDGTAIAEETFKVIYGAYPIYFYDPTFTFAVPDVRWFIKNKTVKAMTSALLAGPAPYLRGAVASAFPSGIKLARESVPVVSGAAQVDLTAKELMETSPEDRLRMQMQLTLTFRSQPDVVNVELRANQDLVRVEDNGAVLPPVQDKSVPSRQIAISGNELVRYENNRVSPLPDMQPVSSLAPRFPAESPVSQTAAFLNEGRTTLYSISPGQPARALTTRSTLSRPSFGLSEWVWSAGPGATGGTEVVAFRPAGIAEGAAVPTVTLSPAWLAGRTVKE
ncbi:MAG TPA: LpqB family beta-propeller domain-containing protein, partial [Arthrobacter sp.]|nr:LpqB family beta-propeller domain-containing protein [Arthrobacter sp.]